MSAERSNEPDAETSAFLWEVHRYTNEYIRFADTKAAFIAGASMALIGALVASSSLDSSFEITPSLWSKVQWLAALGLVLLVAALILSIFAIRPRLRKHSTAGFIYWGSIAGHGSATQYTEQVRALSARGRALAVSDHLFILATIAERKYAYVDRAMILGVIGGVFAGLALLVQHATR